MHNTLLLQTFRSLSQRERREFQKFIDSPFFNQRDDVRRLFAFLCRQIPAAERTAGFSHLSKTAAYEHVFPNTAAGRRSAGYDDAAMRYAMSFLFAEIKRFLAYRHWAADEMRTGLHLCKALRERGLDAIFEKERAALETRNQTREYQSIDYYFQQYQLRFEYWEVAQRTDRAGETNIREVGDAFGAFVAASVLRQSIAVLAKPGSRENPPVLPYLAETLAAAAAGKFDYAPAVLVYYHCVKVLSETDPQPHFQQLKTLLAEHWAIFPQAEIRDIFMATINFCIRQLNTGARVYIREALELYRSGLERNLILENGFLSKFTYNNILLLAIAENEWGWALPFLENYREALPPRDRDSSYRYNLATYFFRKKDYPRAQEILRHVEFRDVFYNLDSRRMLVRIYFENTEIAALESLLDSFAAYLRRKRASLGYHKDLNLNFIRFVKTLLHLEPGDRVGRQALREKIIAATYVAEREWLLGKV